MLEPRAAVRNLQAYRPPLAGRLGLRLDFNESTIGCSPRVLAKLRSLDSETLARYPEREPVERDVAEFLGLDAKQVLLTNGVDEAIHLLCSTYLDPGDEAIVVEPTFAMYAFFVQVENARVIRVLSGENFSFPLNEIVEGISSRTKLIAVANPNNPTGAAVASEVLLQVARAAPQAAVLVDEAYFEFHGDSILHSGEVPPNVLVARTFSKAYGLAGLRIGVLAGNTQQIESVRRVTSPYNVNAVALAALPEAIKDQEFMENYVAEVKRGRSMLERELENLGLRYWPSCANFVLTRIGPAHSEFVQSLRRRGILVRDRSSDPGCEGCVRLTVGSLEHTRALMDTLREVVDELDLRRAVQA